MSKLPVLQLYVFVYSYSISPSFVLRAPFYNTHAPQPPPNDIGTVYLQLLFILMIIHYSDNWM